MKSNISYEEAQASGDLASNVFYIPHRMSKKTRGNHGFHR